ncbi:MAG: replication initiation protein [Chitinivibrionales bacterium]
MLLFYYSYMRVPSILIRDLLRLSITEIKIFFLSISGTKKHSDNIELSFKKIIRSSSIGGSQYGQVFRATKKLMERSLVFHNIKKENFKTGFYHYIQFAEQGEGILKVKQSKEIKNLILNSHLEGGYIKVNIKSIMSLKSWYSVRLYLLLCNQIKCGYLNIKYCELKEILNCKDRYIRQQNFLNRCIVEPLQEINNKTELLIKYDVVKKWHTVDHFYFSILARSDRGDIREILDDTHADHIERSYPKDFIEYCLMLTKKIHKPERGTPSGLFLKLLKNNFARWKIENDKRKTFLINKNKPIRKEKDQKVFSLKQYEALPDSIKKTLEKTGGVERWTNNKR